MSLSNVQRKLGYYPIVYNIKNQKFWIPRPGKGDSYVEIDIEVGDGGGSGGPPPGGGGGGGDISLDGYATEDWVEAQGYLTDADIDGLASEQWVLDQEYITIAEVPPPVLDGALVFKGTVATEADLPNQNKVGDLWFAEDDEHLYAWGEDGKWHKLNTVDDVNLEDYATEEWVEGKGYITIDQVPEVNLDGYATEEWVEDKGYITADDIPDVPLDEYARLDGADFTGKTTFFGNGFSIEERRAVTIHDIEFADIWKLNAARGKIEGRDGREIDMYYGHLYFDDIRLNADGSVHAKEFVGDGSKLTNLPIPDGGIPEAPLDGYQYARKNGDWTEIDIPDGFSGDYNDLTNTPDIPQSTSDLTNDSGFITLEDVPPAPDGGIPEAPMDGYQYARKNGAWSEIEIPDVPDVNLDEYARLDGAHFTGFINSEKHIYVGPKLFDSDHAPDGPFQSRYGPASLAVGENYNANVLSFDAATWSSMMGCVMHLRYEPFRSMAMPAENAGTFVISKKEDPTSKAWTAEDTAFGVYTENQVAPVSGNPGPCVWVRDHLQVGKGVIANEFIGDGSKLTGLPPTHWDDIEGKPCIPECCEFDIPIREVYQGDEVGDQAVDINNKDFPDSLVVGSLIEMPKDDRGNYYDATVTDITDRGTHKSLSIDPWQTTLDCYECSATIKFNACGDDEGGAVGINEVLAEGNIADAAQSLKFQVSEADVPYDAPSTKDTIDLDARFASRYGATATIHQVNEPFTIDTDDWDGVYQRAKGYIAAFEVGFNGLYQSGNDDEYFVAANYGMGGAYLSITPQAADSKDEVYLNINTNGLEFISSDLKIRDGSVTATEFIGDGSKLTNLPAAGGAAGIDEVLEVNNTAGTLQSLRFNKPTGENVPEDQWPDWWPDFKARSAYDPNAKPFPAPEPWTIELNTGHRCFGSSYLAAINYDSEGPSHAWDPANDDIEYYQTEVYHNGLVITKSGNEVASYSDEQGSLASYGAYFIKNFESVEKSLNIGFTGISHRAEIPYGYTDDVGLLYAGIDLDSSPYGEDNPNVHIRYDKKSKLGNLESEPVRAFGVSILDDVNQIDLEDDDFTFEVLSDGTVKAKEFIGDGSKLTNLPVGDVDLDEYARLDGAEFTGELTATKLQGDYLGTSEQITSTWPWDNIEQSVQIDKENGVIIYSQGGKGSGTDPDRPTEGHPALCFSNLAGGGPRAWFFDYKGTINSSYLAVGRPNHNSWPEVGYQRGFKPGIYMMAEYTDSDIHDIDETYIDVTASENQTTPIFEVHPAANPNATVSITPEGSITAVEFIGDGSKLTGLPVGGGGADLDENSELHIKSLAAGDNIRTNPTGTGVEVNGELGVVHVKPKSDSATAFEVFKPDGSTTQEASSMFRVSPNGDVQIGHTAIDLKPDGSAVFTGMISGNGTVGYQGNEIRVFSDYASSSTGTGGIHLSYESTSKTSLITAGANDATASSLAFAFPGGGQNPKENIGITFRKGGSADFGGGVSATEFIGDGSKLTGVAPINAPEFTGDAIFLGDNTYFIKKVLVNGELQVKGWSFMEKLSVTNEFGGGTIDTTELYIRQQGRDEETNALISRQPQGDDSANVYIGNKKILVEGEGGGLPDFRNLPALT